MIMMMIQHWLPIVRLSSEASIKMDGDTSSTFRTCGHKGHKIMPQVNIEKHFQIVKILQWFSPNH